MDTIGQDIASLSQRIIKEAGADGIYLSVQSIQDARVSQEVYKNSIAPSELHVLEAANEAGGVNILHICGYEGARNDIHLFTDYPAQVINWAVGPEGISLAEGREIFGGRTVLGGFENGKMVFSTQETRLRFKQKPNVSSQKPERQAWSSVRIVRFK